MRQPTLKSNEQNAKKAKLVTEPPWNWLDVPSDVMANILRRIGLVEMVENARKVCTTWCGICRDICKDPAMWRVIYLDALKNRGERQRRRREKTCKYILENSQGRLVDLTVVNSYDLQLLSHLAERSSQLKRLVFVCCGAYMVESWSEREIFKKFTLLEELSFFNTAITGRCIYEAGRFWPLLTTLKLNQKPGPYVGLSTRTSWNVNEIATAIGESLPGLRHLELIGNSMSNRGLKKILEGCPHLESLDLRGCFDVKLEGVLGERWLLNIKNLKRPMDSLDDCPYIYDESFH